jgi:uncharacterized protein (DUF2336 family)
MQGSNVAIVRELESSLRDGSPDKRQEVLKRVTDLFVGAATDYSDEVTGLFDQVMGHLIHHVESRALVELSTRLAPLPNAPTRTVRRLARHDAIEVSGPLLSGSKRLDDAELIDIATTKSQAHLASIAQRPQINEAVTEVLVDHGNADVANAVASNTGAKISNLTMAKLVMRADGDDRLAGSIASRNDISRVMFRHLMAQATETVRARLLVAAPPNQRDVVQQVIDALAAQVGPRKRGEQEQDEARRIVAGFSQDTNLTRAKVASFAGGKRTAELLAALSVLSGLSVDEVSRLVDAPSTFGLMALCRSIMLDWRAANAIVAARVKDDQDRITVEEFHAQYDALSPAAAQQVIRHWQARMADPVANVA